MTKLIILLVMIISSCQCFSQQTPATVSEESFMLKSKHQKTTGWILLGGGTALAAAGLIKASSDLDKDPFGTLTGDHVGGALLTIAGGAAMLASIPCFIASGKNKRKASVAFSTEKLPRITYGSMA